MDMPLCNSEGPGNMKSSVIVTGSFPLNFNYSKSLSETQNFLYLIPRLNTTFFNVKSPSRLHKSNPIIHDTLIQARVFHGNTTDFQPIFCS